MTRAGGGGLFWGVVLVALGVLFLLANTGVLANVDWSYVWPVVLIGLGAWLILARVGPGSGSATVDSSEQREGLQQAKLDIAIGAGQVDVRSAPLADQLYRVHLEHAGSSPEVKLDRSTGTVRVSQRFDWFFGARRFRLDAQLSDAIPWQVSCATGAIRGAFDLSGVALQSFDCQTGASRIELSLAAPAASCHCGSRAVD